MNGIKIKVFRDNLYRANKTPANKNIFASVNYRGAPRKYFTLRKNELNAYTKKGTTYKKTWKVLRDLKLVNILDPDTRQNLEYYFETRKEKKALNNAFPVKNSRPSRNSFNVKVDDIVLDKLCELGYDGYYMETISAFHSEVGLCSSALDNLKLVEKSEEIVAPKNVENKRRNNTTKKNLSGIKPKALSFFN